MRPVIAFFIAQMKKMCRLLPKVLTAGIITCLCAGLVFALYLKSDPHKEKHQKYKVAIVGNAEESYLGFGISAIRTLDDSRYVIDFVTMTEEEARDAFFREEITAIVMIPDGLVDSLVNGQNDVKIKYIISDGQKGLSSILLEEYSKVASTLIANSQAGIFAMQEQLIKEGRYDILPEATDELNLKYLGMVTDRTDLCEVEIVGVSHGLSTIGYLCCGVVVFVLLLLGITYSPVFSKRSMGLSAVYRSKGISALWQILCEYIAYFLMVFLCIIVVWAMLLGMGMTGLFPKDLLPEVAFSATEGLRVLFPVIILFTALQFFLYEMTSGVVSSMLLQFLLGTAMCYISGCFYPAYFFPDSVRKVGEILPTGLSVNYLAECVLGEPVWRFAVGFSIYIILCLTGACLIRQYRIQRG